MRAELKMTFYLNDTNSKAEGIQISLLRNLKTSGRTMLMRSLSEAVINLSRRAILRTHAQYNERELDLIFVRLHYGDDIADRLKIYLEQKMP